MGNTLAFMDHEFAWGPWELFGASSTGIWLVVWLHLWLEDSGRLDRGRG